MDGPTPPLVLPDPDEKRRINAELIGKIRRAAKDMILPTWFTAFPQPFGTKSGANLKADQWRAIATLYAPIVLIREWPNDEKPDSAIWLRLTTDLMSAILACTSHTVSPESINEYESKIRSYESTIQEKYPELRWVPNYHGALHIPELLKDYGPAFNWWTFPFERLIRELQDIETNDRLGMCNSSSHYNLLILCAGDLEQTMASAFYLGARLRRYGYGNQFGASSEIMKDAIRDLLIRSDSIKGSNIKGTLSSDVFGIVEEAINEDDEDDESEGEFFI